MYEAEITFARPNANTGVKKLAYSKEVCGKWQFLDLIAREWIFDVRCNFLNAQNFFTETCILREWINPMGIFRFRECGFFRFDM